MEEVGVRMGTFRLPLFLLKWSEWDEWHEWHFASLERERHDFT